MGFFEGVSVTTKADYSETMDPLTQTGEVGGGGG